MPDPTQMDIVRRAYELWQQAGEPKGRDWEFYLQAEKELRNENDPPADMPDKVKGWDAMAYPTDEQIRERAYQLWEKLGKPEGRTDEFWHRAEQELLNEERSSQRRNPYNFNE
jgi:hypothetical protein